MTVIPADGGPRVAGTVATGEQVAGENGEAGEGGPVGEDGAVGTLGTVERAHGQPSGSWAGRVWFGTVVAVALGLAFGPLPAYDYDRFGLNIHPVTPIRIWWVQATGVHEGRFDGLATAGFLVLLVGFLALAAWALWYALHPDGATDRTLGGGAITVRDGDPPHVVSVSGPADDPGSDVEVTIVEVTMPGGPSPDSAPPSRGPAARTPEMS